MRKNLVSVVNYNIHLAWQDRAQLRPVRPDSEWLASALVLPAQDPVLKDQVLNGNITHSKHARVTREQKNSFEWGMFPIQNRVFFPSNMTMF